MIWASTMLAGMFFSMLSLMFPIRMMPGPKYGPGEILNYVRALVCPVIAAVTWYIMAALSVAATNVGAGTLYYYYLALCLTFVVLFIGMAVYLAFFETVETLEGKGSLTQ